MWQRCHHEYSDNIYAKFGRLTLVMRMMLLTNDVTLKSSGAVYEKILQSTVEGKHILLAPSHKGGFAVTTST